ncbi:MAG: nucleoside monophosphate kinase [Planctomycetota bacterium]|nr:nucleoside monophosphate kinase [Planctomycetota bacterium]
MNRLERPQMNQLDQDPARNSEVDLLLPEGSPTRLPAVLMFGMPGVGKGTQGTLLGTMTGMFHVSTGTIFRNLNPESSDGKLIFGLIDRGELVPDELAVAVWMRWLNDQISEGNYNPVNDVLILDGIPRRLRQCELLEEYVDVLAVIHLEAASDEPIVKRLLGRAQLEGRADDADEQIIRRRFEIYREMTRPVLDYYSPEIVHTINPLGTQMEVKKRILECVIPAVRKSERAG